VKEVEWQERHPTLGLEKRESRMSLVFRLPGARSERKSFCAPKLSTNALEFLVGANRKQTISV